MKRLGEAQKKQALIALKMILAVAFASVGMGNTCSGGSGAKSTFNNARLSGSASSSASASKSWRTAEIIDLGQYYVLDGDPDAACYRHDQNRPFNSGVAHINGGATVDESIWYYPMSVFTSTAGQFQVAFNRGDGDEDLVSCPTSTGLTAINAYVVSKNDIADDEPWAEDSANFTQIDLGHGVDSIRPLTAVDSDGNATLVYFAKTADEGVRRPVGLRYNYGFGAWSSPQILSDTTLGSTPAFDVSTAAAIAIDSNKNAVVVFAQEDEAYFNQYRPGVGWRFTSTPFPAGAQWQQVPNSVAHRGMDIGFDGYGHGYGVYVSSTPSLIVARWNGSVSDNFDGNFQVASSGLFGAADGYPRIYVAPGGSATVFHYINVAGTTGDLYCSYFDAPATAGSSAMGTYHAPVIISTGVTGVTVFNDNDVIRPILAYRGSNAVVGYIHSGTLYVKQYAGDPNCQTWTTIGSHNGGGTVTWADLAINASGHVAAVMSVVDGTGEEKVYGTIYNGTSWTTVTRLDDDTTFDPGVPAAAGVGPARPSVAIDSSGNAVATFTMNDTLAAYPMGKRRRAAAAAYR